MKKAAILKVALIGATGRMGHEIIKLVRADETLRLAAIVDEKALWELHEIQTRLKELKEKGPQVVIDFSSPEGSMKAAQWCVENGVPLVTGTTGWGDRQKRIIEKASHKVPILSSSNMSLGIHVLSEALSLFAKKYSQADVEFEEVHHKNKKDRPSGTAKFLKEVVTGAKNKTLTIGEPVSVRGGEIFGIHKTYFFGQSEWVCFEHHATERAVFARGALVAARWIVGKKPGLYSMKNIFQ